MPFTRPSLVTIINRIKADINARLVGSDAQLPRSKLAVDAVVWGGVMHGEYGALEKLSKQILPIDGDPETVLKWSAMLDIPRLQPQKPSGEWVATGTTGNVIAAQSRVQSGLGIIYITQADATVGVGGSVNVAVIAEEAGTAGNIAAGSTLTLVSPIPGVQSEGVVGANGISGGADLETIDALNERLLFRLQNPPRGGSASDYEFWARSAHPSVTRVFVSPGEAGQGTVTVRFTTDNEPSIIPSAPVVQAVTDYIAARAPVDVLNLLVLAPVAVPRNITFSALLPNTVAVQATVTAELQDLFKRAPVPGVIIPESQISEAVSIASGETSHTLSASGTSLAVGEVDVLGSVTWPV